MPDTPYSPRGGISRRDFFGLSGALAAFMAGGQALDFGREVLAQERARSAAGSSNDRFLSENRALFRNLTVGASFAPEQWSDDDNRRGEGLRALDWAVRDLGMRAIRLGMRWSRVERRPGDIDLQAYRPYLDYAFENDLRIALNLGPLRTFRWPEEHPPSWLGTRIQLPPQEATVRPGSDLAGAASDYLARLLDLLRTEYGAERLASVALIQVENEPFYGLGLHKWKVTPEYLKAMIRQVMPYFPSSRFLITSAGRLNFGPVRDLFVDMAAESEAFRGRFVMGFDYHYKTPLRDSFPVIRHLDPITYSRVGYESCEGNRRAARAISYGIEVTEGQAEPFSHLESPGNSAREFRFMLYRCADRVLLMEAPALVRVWGIEEMAKKALGGRAGAEHEAIFDLVRRLNGVA